MSTCLTSPGKCSTHPAASLHPGKNKQNVLQWRHEEVKHISSDHVERNNNKNTKPAFLICCFNSAKEFMFSMLFVRLSVSKQHYPFSFGADTSHRENTQFSWHNIQRLEWMTSYTVWEKVWNVEQFGLISPNVTILAKRPCTQMHLITNVLTTAILTQAVANWVRVASSSCSCIFFSSFLPKTRGYVVVIRINCRNLNRVCMLSPFIWYNYLQI